MQTPIGHINIGAHHTRGTDDERRNEKTETDSHADTENTDHQAVRGIMKQYFSVAEAERLERADLHLFVGGDSVHGRDHCENRDGKEQHGQDRSHRFSFLRFAKHSCVGNVFIFRGDKQSGSRCVLYSFFKGFLI